MAEEQEVTLKSLFSNLDGDRSSVITRADECAKYTFPALMLEDSAKGTDLKREEIQSFGARLVRFLAGKFSMSLVPSYTPFFKLDAEKEAIKEITDGDVQMEEMLKKKLSEQEDLIAKEIDSSNFKVYSFDILRSAISIGDVLIEVVDGDYRVFGLRNYVIKRDEFGKIVTIIIKELINPISISEEISNQLTPEQMEKKELDLYTRVQLEDGQYVMTQEIEEIGLDTEDTFKRLESRFISVPFSLKQGEDYGRGFVEENLGDFIRLNKLLKVIDKSIAKANRDINLVNPNGYTKLKDVQDSNAGDWIAGNANDLSNYMPNKANEIAILAQNINELKRDLSQSFLFGSNNVRDAERVTAKEIEMVASELEQSFGGVYNGVAENIQKPLVLNAMDNLGMNIKDITDGKDVKLVITTGSDALNRNKELRKVNVFLEELNGLAGLMSNEILGKKLNWSSIIDNIAINVGVANKNFINTQEEEVQTQNTEDVRELGKQVAPEMAKQAVQQGIQ